MALFVFGKEKQRFLQIFLFFALFINAAVSECNVCQVNQAACINSTSFYLCFGEATPNTEKLYHCKDGFDCTNLNAICVQTSSMRPPSCGDTSLCGMCSAHRNYLFACQSRTTFQMCYGAIRPSGQIGYCPDGYVCDANSDTICAPGAQTDIVTCDIVAETADTTTTTTPAATSPTPPTTLSTTPTTTPTTTTTITTTTPSIPLTPTEVCARYRTNGLFPTIPQDPYCKRYVSCSYSNGSIKGVEYGCSVGTFFNSLKEQCTFSKPEECI